VFLRNESALALPSLEEFSAVRESSTLPHRAWLTPISRARFVRWATPHRDAIFLLHPAHDDVVNLSIQGSVAGRFSHGDVSLMSARSETTAVADSAVQHHSTHITQSYVCAWIAPPGLSSAAYFGSAAVAGRILPASVTMPWPVLSLKERVRRYPREYHW